MTVWIVEHECDDSYYIPYLVDIFLTEDLAKQFVESKPIESKHYYEITETLVKERID